MSFSTFERTPLNLSVLMMLSFGFVTATHADDSILINPASSQACAALESNADRLVCYDKIFRTPNVVAPVIVSEQRAAEMSGNRVRAIVITLVSFTILLVAGFGIFNILNMTVTQKINDIAILKAMGFKGKDVITIFVTQAVAIGIMGVIGGVIAAIILVTFLKKIYIGADVGYFPIDYVPLKFLQGVVVGMIITFLAGYIPARKAAKVDPVTIFRK